MRNTYHLLTFGCQMNVRDSRWLCASLEEAGFLPKPIGEAGIILINTCSVREKPEKKVASLISQIAGASSGNPDIIIGITGCVAQQLGKRLFDFGPQVRLVAGPDCLEMIPDALERLIRDPALRIDETSFKSLYPERRQLAEKWPHSSALVNIMQGCDNFCAYCIVPYTRGRQKSRLKKDILEECARVLDTGATEITLLGQNVNAWGKDRQEGIFPDLLKTINDLPGLRRLHFVTPHPADMDPGTIESFSALDKLCPRLHLPLQSGSDTILARMRRRYDRKSYLALVRSLYRHRPDLALSTDLITGFPGESEEDFQATLEMMEACRFMSSFSFCYSDRPGTLASRMPDKVPYEIKQDRLQRLQNLQDKLGGIWLAKRVGEETEILLEAPSRRWTRDNPQWQGRDPYGVPVNVPLKEAKAGEYRKIRINAPARHSLKGIDLA